MRSNFDDVELAEDADPGSFPTERSRRRAIGFDRWSGRHPVLVTVLTGVGLGLLVWLALRHAPGGEGFVVRLVCYLAFVVGSMVVIARLALRARKRYHER
ncbi:hypothetical protein LZG04_18195 [Saccharothrix sp. S26]|uniref:hypothetical protein n=1 Tax=Saccharothrix sp. S26 TaxID=2907215 RepID=UPI001F370707|nr:hypothetical protein [Saccharothrix sp. S26]MCE6996720.1 hypothetical protein [Saccharothrix sp. S26]